MHRGAAAHNLGGMNPDRVREEIYDQRIVVVHRERDAETCVRKARAVHEGGLTVQEVTWFTPGATKAIREIARLKLGMIGAGTILDPAAAKEAVAAGAQFLVSPGYSQEVAAWAKKKRVVYIPGCATPTEMLRAWDYGIRPIKVFPAPDLGGPGFLKRVLASVAFLELLPTGGMGIDLLKEYLDAGAVAVGLGAGMTDCPEARADDGRGLVAIAAKALEIARQAKPRA